MFFFTPYYLKEAKHFLHAARKTLCYNKDLLSPEQLHQMQGGIAALSQAMRLRNREAVSQAMQEIEAFATNSLPARDHPGWRENIEVFIIAILLATGIRAYFLQPFKIPSGSMQPTLYGIVGQPSLKQPPHLLKQAFDLIVRGRSYIHVVAKSPEIVMGLKPWEFLGFFTFTQIQCSQHSYLVFAPRITLFNDFGVQEGREYQTGEPIACGTVTTGDQLFVDKVSYYFTPPHRGDIFVFKTLNIRKIQSHLPPGIESEYYIKRLAGLPGDTLQIDSPQLWINNHVAKEPGLMRVMSCKQGYRGYSNMPLFTYLYSPEQKFTVPEATYFALGDNSYHSSDSRDWGIVPQENLTGKAFFVLWPWSSRWGFIR